MRSAILSIGTSTWNIQLAERPGYIDTVHSAVYICPHCEEIWARIRVSGMWDAWTLGMPCERCPSTRRQRIPGSLLRNVAYAGRPDEDEADLQLMRALPAELLAREFDLHLKALETDYGSTVPDERREDSSRNSLAGDPEFAKYFQSTVTWHLPERTRSSIATYDNRDPDVFTILSAAVAANLAAGSECPSRGERDDHGTDGHGQDPHHRDPG